LLEQQQERHLSWQSPPSDITVFDNYPLEGCEELIVTDPARGTRISIQRDSRDFFTFQRYIDLAMAKLTID